MGCDIHAHIEVKKDGVWYHYAAPKIDRNYTLFAMMTGERNDHDSPITPIASIYELPSDMSLVAKICYEQERGDAHHPAVLTKDDLWELQDWLNNDDTRPAGICALDLEQDIFRTYINGNAIAGHQGFDDVRVIVWYDN